MALRQMGEAVDLRRAIPEINSRLGPQAYDQALRERLRAVSGLGEQANQFSAEQAYKRQQAAYAQRMQELNSRQIPEMSGATGGGAPGQGAKYNGKYYDLFNGMKAPITFGYGAKYKNSHSGLDWHHGIDFGVKRGTGFYAPLGGQIVGLYDTGNKGFGRNVRVKFDNGAYGIFGHLSSWLDNLKVGSKFGGGSLLGYTGDTGDSSGDHLHFETRWDVNDPSTSFNFGSWFGW